MDQVSILPFLTTEWEPEHGQAENVEFGDSFRVKEGFCTRAGRLRTIWKLTSKKVDNLSAGNDDEMESIGVSHDHT